MKAQRRIDPELMRLKEERKRRKMNQLIRELERQPRKLKSLEECAVFSEAELKERLRPTMELSEEEIDRRAAVYKQWNLNCSCAFVMDGVKSFLFFLAFSSVG